MSYVLNSDSAGASRPDPPDQHRPPKLNLAFPACLSQSRLTGGYPLGGYSMFTARLRPDFGLWTLDLSCPQSSTPHLSQTPNPQPHGTPNRSDRRSTLTDPTGFSPP